MLIWTIASSTPFGSRRREYQGEGRAIAASLTGGQHVRLAAAAPVADDPLGRERHCHVQPPGAPGGHARPLPVALDAAGGRLPVLRPLDLHRGGAGPLYVDREVLRAQ